MLRHLEVANYFACKVLAYVYARPCACDQTESLIVYVEFPTYHRTFVSKLVEIDLNGRITREVIRTGKSVVVIRGTLSKPS